ncbi:MAG: anaerobic ribonucleoside-triphosphate reductase activating protein [Ruthenibacterium sp.]
MNETLNLASIVEDSIVDGPGIRVTVFCQGCPHACPGCHNPQSHPFGTGTDLTVQEIYDVVQRSPLCRGVTFSGGEPFSQPEGFAALAQLLRGGGYEVACYTGYTFEQLQKNGTLEQQRLLELLDVRVDGPFVLAQRDLSLRFRGSTNQRILDVPRSLARGEATKYDGARWTGEDARC